MNSRERVAAAMGHAVPDRVPVMCQLALGHYFLRAGRRPSDIWFDSGVFAETLVAFRERYGFDGILVNLPGRPSGWRTHLADRRDAGDREILRWKAGLETRFPPDDNPHAFLDGGGTLPRARCDAVDPEDPGTYRTAGIGDRRIPCTGRVPGRG